MPGSDECLFMFCGSRKHAFDEMPISSEPPCQDLMNAWLCIVGHKSSVCMQEDVGAMYASRDPEEYGRARLSHVADTWKGKLDPAEYLNPGRHGEWTSASGLCPAHNPGASVITNVGDRSANHQKGGHGDDDVCDGADTDSNSENKSSKGDGCSEDKVMVSL